LIDSPLIDSLIGCKKIPYTNKQYTQITMADDAPSDEDEVDMAKWLIFSIAIVCTLVLVPILSRVKRSRGKKLIYHMIFVIISVVLLVLVPESFQDIVFSVRNTVLPILL
jgi:MFS-type transporter involved in bile tolerance (Atg22 family)